MGGVWWWIRHLWSTVFCLGAGIVGGPELFTGIVLILAVIYAIAYLEVRGKRGGPQ